MSAPAPGDLLAGRYRLLEELGGGGMGIVFRARDERDGRDVAVKILRHTSHEAARRLRREARATESLDPARVARVHDVGETPSGAPFLVMEHIEGRTLRALLERGAVDRREALRVVREIATTLAEAHRRGLVHRDVKPANVIVGPDGRVVLLDFGIAKHIDPGDDTGERTTQLTAEGVIIGTPAYLAPEQALGREIAPAVDQFALAVTAFELLTGRLPWSATDVPRMLAQVLAEAPLPVNAVNPDVPAAFDAVLSRALAKSPPERFASVEAFADALDAAERGVVLVSPASLTHGGPTTPSGGPSGELPSLPRADTSGAGAFLRELARADPRPPPDASGAGPPSLAGPDPLLGHVIDAKYRVDSALGRGGMGTVYSAVHLGTGRAVALKVLVPELTASEAAIERFRREARATGQIRHPSVVDVTDFGFTERDGVRFAYLVMELLQGKTLRAVLHEGGRLPLDVALDVIAQVCAGIAEAHRLGILHRDLKPENIHLEPRGRGRYRVKVLDFGIAKLVHEALAATTPLRVEAEPSKQESSGATGRSLTHAGGAVGTPRYMSPEQWLGNANDVRSDIYSLAVVAYEMLAGEPPFAGKEWRAALGDAPVAPPSLRTKVPSVPRAVERVVLAALAKEPAARPPSVAAFVAGLRSGAETTGNLLRTSIALCADHYLSFSRRCLLLTVPPVVLAAADVAVDLLARAGLVSHRVEAALDWGAVLGEFLSIFAWAPVAGMMVTAVAGVLSPDGAPRPAPPRAELWRTTRRAFPSSVAAYALILVAGTIAIGIAVAIGRLAGSMRYLKLTSVTLVVVLGSAVLAPFGALGPVAALEGATGLAPLRRSSSLLRPMWRAAFGVQLLYNALTQGLPALVTLAIREVATGPAIAEPTFDVERVREFFLWLGTLVLIPFVMAPSALLYLRAREAEGRPLD